MLSGLFKSSYTKQLESDLLAANERLETADQQLTDYQTRFDEIEVKLQQFVTEVNGWQALASHPWGNMPSDMKESVDSLPKDVRESLAYFPYLQGGYAPISDDDQPNEFIRRIYVNISRNLASTDVVCRQGLNLWTNFGFGQTIEIDPRDELAKEVWQEFVTASRNRRVLNQRHIANLSHENLRDGEVFLFFYANKLRGTTTVNKVNSLAVYNIITLPSDRDKPIWYIRHLVDRNKKEYRVAYPDFAASKDERARAKQYFDQGTITFEEFPEATKETDVAVLHVAFQTEGLRGWPMPAVGYTWHQAHSKFRQDRALVAAARAAFADKIKIDSGTQGIAALQRQFNSTIPNSPGEYFDRNPPPPAGGTWVENEQLSRQRLSLDTAASDAEKDGNSLLLMASLIYGVFPHYMGAGEAFRLATATAMETPMLRQFTRYSLFWRSIFIDMASIVFDFYNKYKESRTGPEIQDYTVDVTSDAVVMTPLADINASIKSVLDSLDAGAIEPDQANSVIDWLLSVSLQLLGAQDVDDIMMPDEQMPDDNEDEDETEELEIPGEILAEIYEDEFPESFFSERPQ